MNTIPFIYLIIINIIAFSAMGIDKRRAIKSQWRIPEKVLFLYVILGGGIGGCLGMFGFRHKTRHWYFRLFFPLITVVEYVLLLLLFESTLRSIFAL